MVIDLLCVLFFYPIIHAKFQTMEAGLLKLSYVDSTRIRKLYVRLDDYPLYIAYNRPLLDIKVFRLCPLNSHCPDNVDQTRMLKRA